MTDLFSFHEITEDEIRKQISKLNGSKATPIGDIPAEMLKSTINVHVSNLPHVSKIIERIMYIQIKKFMEDKLSKLLTGFRKKHRTQGGLVNMFEKSKNTLDKGGFVCAIFMDLSKVFGTMDHDLSITKLGAYGFKNMYLFS